MATADQLKKLRQRAGLSMRAMARNMGLADGSSYQRYEDATVFDERRLPLEKYDDFYGALIGRGNPPITLEEINALFSINRKGVLTLDVSKQIPVNVRHSNSVLGRIIPLLSPSDLAKSEHKMTTRPADAPRFATDEDVGPNAMAVKLTDDSGAPDFPEDTIVVADPDETLTPGCFVLAQIEGEPEAKIGRYALRINDNGERVTDIRAINQNYPSYSITPSRGGRIIGRIVRSQRRH